MRILAIVFCLGFAGGLLYAPAAWSTNGNSARETVAGDGHAPSTQEIRFQSSEPGRCLDCFVGGVRLRNAPDSPPDVAGTITVPADVAAGAIFAELYWATMTSGSPPPDTETFNGADLTREACGPVTEDPCWAETEAYAWHADVLGLLSAGDNELDGFPDSGVEGVGPETFGATLVVVYISSQADKAIVVTCGNDSHPEVAAFFDNDLPEIAVDGIGADLYFIGADGQRGLNAFSDEVFWNGAALDAGDAWQGLDPGPGTGSWDSMRFSVFTAAPNVATSGNPRYPETVDCVNWVATVLCVKRAPCQATPVEPSTWGRIKSQYGNQ